MKKSIGAAVAVLTLAAGLVATTGGLAGAAAAPTVTVYDATVSPTPGNVPSVGFEATGTSEFGDEVSLAGTARKLSAVTVTMSSWGCQRGAWNTGNCSSDKKAKELVPITLNIYNPSVTNDDGSVTPGRLITRTTQQVAVPYRPTANLKFCNTSNNSAGKWYDKASGACYNGYAFNAIFNFKSLKQTLPDDVVIGVAYNTTDYGYSPIGTSADCYGEDGGCIYDSLNVGVDGDGGPTVGSKPRPDTVFQNTRFAGNLCDGGAVAKTDEFNLDSPGSACWVANVPNIKVTAS